MNSAPVRNSVWSRAGRWLDLWANALDTDAHELTSRRIDALERRLQEIEAVLRTAAPPGRDPG